jgi:pimeloyl-ACP methyl ester carboxylesterase
VPDIALNYRVEGQGPPLLLVHGFGISFHIWRNLLPLLTSHLSVVVVELPGIGATPMLPEGGDYLETSIAGIQGVRQRLGIDKWSVLGYSTGSRLAEAYVRADAAHICRAIFLCPLLIDPAKVRALRFGLNLDRRFPTVGTWILSAWRLKLLISWLGFNFQRDRMANEWYAEIGAAPMGVLKDTIRAMDALVSHPFSVPVPYAMIWGDRDLVPLRPRPGGEHDYFVHGRHAAPMESADEVARAILSLEQGNKTPDGGG